MIFCLIDLLIRPKLMGDHLSNLNEDIQAAKEKKLKHILWQLLVLQTRWWNEKTITILKDVKDTRGIWQVFSLIPL